MAISPSIPPRERAPGFEERLRALPGTPGVYIMHNRADDIIYVGKAVSLKNRVRSYFGSLKGQAPKVMRMVDEVFDFEYILTDTELEALILENQLIKKHRPRYNIKLKDDKTYPYIKVTTNEAWPRVLPTRRVLNDGAQYFGPFPGMGTVYQTLDLLDKLFPFRTCDKEITGNDARPCVQYFIHRCLGPCAGLADKPAYDDAIKQVVLFLNRKHDIIIRNLKSKMGEASENLEFERAAVFRDRIRSLERVLEEQKVFSATKTDEDVIAFARNDGEACVQIFFIRGGKLLGREHYMLEGTADSTPGEILESFMTQFYDDASYVPPKVVLQDDVSDAEIIESWLRVRRGTKVTLSVPRRGQKRDMVEMAARNAAETLEQFRLRWLSDEQKSTAALTELQALLRLPVWPQRIECYDVAHLQGTDVAGAMVVFEQGMPKKKEYR
ncbi:MAG TPA: excinuclease ABC subunit UvrC, partial [Chloroflexia bacterium]|nr:excinuclease ABC subunit UvrC [Chloroflexia bacterium]